ncbi:hypothetical protein [Sutcliffiella rhizosphaerae]|uniref:Uncharacterized protein n=1 Tax=Sutcliffiella rhizosphaerae TaxID=2880967 RepID=A0ABM8YT30_9BACI|nr:hypothetical protein [Sutcliffiella rhizosphaerae]CAG9623126.1 hypothetical protein BACCIP111883_03922 [Sutcliffiella rhizosphaerae]
MKVKYLLHFVLLLTLFIFHLFPSNSLATSWAYPFVVWNGYIYEVSDEYVNMVESEIGHVTRYSDMESYSGNFSNAYKKGTKYYSIQEISTDEAIAVEVKDGKYKKAIIRGEYAGGRFDYLSLMIKILVILGVAFAMFFVIKRIKK